MHKYYSKSLSNITVDECCERVYSGGTPSTGKSDYWNGSLPWLSSGETRSRFIIATEKFITEKGAGDSSTKKAFIGDIVMASAGQGFTRGQTSMLLLDTYVNQSVVVMHPKQNYSSYLLFMLASSYNKLRSWSDSSSTRGSMSGSLLKTFELPELEESEMESFEQYCAPIISLINGNLCENHLLTKMRDTLLPKLMSGEIDVSQVDITQLNNHLCDC